MVRASLEEVQDVDGHTKMQETTVVTVEKYSKLLSLQNWAKFISALEDFLVHFGQCVELLTTVCCWRFLYFCGFLKNHLLINPNYERFGY